MTYLFSMFHFFYTGPSINNTSYLPPLSILRLLLCLPLFYHTLSGTRLKYTFAYSSIHVISAGTVLAHFFAFSNEVYNKSHSIWLPTLSPLSPLEEDYTSTSTMSSADNATIGSVDDGITILPSGQPSDDDKRTVEEFDLIWLLLTLSLISIGLHIVILLHVRSSAPTTGDLRVNNKPQEKQKSHEEQKRKLLAYFIYHQYAALGNEEIESESERRTTAAAASMTSSLRNKSSLFQSSKDSFDRPTESSSDDDSLTLTEAFLSSDENDENDFESGLISRRKRNGERARMWGSTRLNRKVSFQKLVGLRLCFSDGYEDFLSEIRSRFEIAKQEWKLQLEDMTDRINQNGTNNVNLFPHLTQSLPFRTLLHLYAHEDVFSNEKLDRAFSSLDGQKALSFYAPQLMCFLLHNAYLNTGRLEKWILEHCRKNVHFAHRCFWFLRAWCLEGDMRNIDETHTNGSLHRVQSVNVLGDMKISWEKSPKRVGSENGLVEGRIVEKENEQGSKFSSEEKKILKNLVSKVMESGEYAARQLEYGPSTRSDNSINGTALMETSALHSNCYNEEALAIDVKKGIPSLRHLNAATSKEIYGFIPQNSSFEETSKNESSFMRTPNFLDALIQIADDLLLQPRQNRTKGLRRRLIELEQDFLPSNSIYVPVNNCMHRVWRIVSSESIALSTKERVPCIVYLEVINHRDHIEDSGRLLKISENEALIKWYTCARVPQRHNSLFTKVSTYTQKGLRKLREDFEENQEKLFGTGESSEFLNNTTFQMVVDEENQVTESSPTEKNKSVTEYNEEKRNEEGLSLVHDDLSLQSSIPLSTNTSTPTKKLGQWAAGTQDLTTDHEDQNVNEQLLENRAIKENDLLGTQDRIEITPPTAIYMTSSAKQLYGSTKESKSNNNDKERRKDAALGRPPPVVFKEDFKMKQDRIRQKSAYGKHPNWRLLPILIKSNDDLRQEQLASQLIHCMANILARGKVPVWLYPYEIVALTFRGGIIEAIPDTISIDSLRKNYPDFTDLKNFFEQHFGKSGSDGYEDAKANFVESLAAYSMVCFLLQIKDRHNGNILLDNKGHMIHIDFGFFFLSSPGKNSGFESAPFKLTSEFVELMDGADSRAFAKFRELCYRAFLELRKNCFQITLLVQMLAEGNEDLNCFRGRPHDAIVGIQERFRLDLNDRACLEYVNSLINDSVENWTTTCYDRYQRCFVGVM